MDQYLKYNEDFHIVICCQHKFAISPDWVERHFRQFHNTILLATHQEVCQIVKLVAAATCQQFTISHGPDPRFEHYFRVEMSLHRV